MGIRSVYIMRMTGKELIALRHKLGLTQAALAEKIGVTKNSVARWEREELGMREPVAKLIRLLARGVDTQNRKGAKDGLHS